MNRITTRLLTLSVLFLLLSCNAPGGHENTVILMKTSLGDIKLRLYDETPLHRDNFIKLINDGFYEGISFHRVINGFMIQAGDPETRTVPLGISADSLNTYTIPAEFNKTLFHKRGALAAAREGNDVNPEMRSSGTHFYIVQGVLRSEEDLLNAEARINSDRRQALFYKLVRQVADSARITGEQLSDAEIQERVALRASAFLAPELNYEIPASQREVYKSIGGVPRLDGTYTVFGEVLEGLDVVDKIASVKTGAGDKPVEDVKILKIKIIE